MGIAQSAERVVWDHEAVGSIPTSRIAWVIPRLRESNLTKNSHCAGSGDAPTPRHPATSRDVRVAAEQEPFLQAILSRLAKKLVGTTSAPLLHKLGL